MRVKPDQSAMACLTLAAGLTVLAAACERSDKALGTEREREDVRAEKAVALGNALDSIVLARCDREARCNNIGADRRYASRDACLSKIHSDWHDELNLTECPGGVDQNELSECLQEIRNEDCNNPFEKLGRVAACRSGELCRKKP
jgi:hypothetical protein